MAITTAYLRSGRVHRDRNAFEGGDSLASYMVVIDVEGNRVIETERIGGKKYRSLWTWSEEDEEKGRAFGTIPLLEIE